MQVKLNWFCLTCLINNTGAFDVKFDGSGLEEKSSFLGLTFSSKLDWGFFIISVAKATCKKIEPLICSGTQSKIV